MSEQNMTAEIVSLRNENAVLKEAPALANQQLEWFRKQIFGRKTEQTSVVMEKEFGVQLSMFEKEEKSATKSADTISDVIFCSDIKHPSVRDDTLMIPRKEGLFKHIF